MNMILKNEVKGILLLSFLLSVFFCFSQDGETQEFSPVKNPEIGLNWKEGGPRYTTYQTITGKNGLILVPTAYCAPMGTLTLGGEFTFSTRSPYGGLAAIPKITFSPFYLFEFGFSKEFGYDDVPRKGWRQTLPYSQSSGYFDSTPYFFHYKIRMLDWRFGAVAFGQDFEYVPDNSGSSSRGASSTTIYAVFTAVTRFFGSFTFGLGKTFYFTRLPDARINFYAGWIYSVPGLGDRLQFAIDFSNADYRSGEDYFKMATEDRGCLNFQIRGILVKLPKFQWTLTATWYDFLDLSNGYYPYVNINGSLATTFNFDLF